MKDLGRPRDSGVSAGGAYGRDLSPPLPPPPPPPPSLLGARPPPPTRGIPESGSRFTRPSVGGVVCPRVESPAPRTLRPRGRGGKGRGGGTAAPSHSGGSPGGGGAEARAGGEQRRGEALLGGERAGCSGTPPPASAGALRALWGGLGLAREPLPPGREPATTQLRLRSSVTRPPKGLGRACTTLPTPRIPAHPRVPCIPSQGGGERLGS